MGTVSRAPHQIGVITCTANVVGGDPVLAGTRIPAAMIARAGPSAKESWPDITNDDIAACVAWWDGNQEATLYAVRDLVDQGRRATPHEVRIVLEQLKLMVDTALGVNVVVDTAGKKGSRGMTVRELRYALSALPSWYADHHVVLSRDAEGNGYATLRKLRAGRYDINTGDVVLDEWEEEWAELDMPRNAIVLFP